MERIASPFGHADFALRVQGNGMLPTFANDDIVFLAHADSVPDGELAAIEYDGHYTVKRVYRTADGFILENDSCELPPMYLKPDEFRIIGKPIGFTRAIA